MSQRLAQDNETLSEVNVIPLADLSLVLLIILMVLSPMVTQALIQVAAANAQKARNQQELTTPETPVVVSFETTGLKLNGQVMASDLEFVQKLEAVMGPRRDKSVMLTAAPTVLHGDVVHIMDMIQRHGAKDLVMLKWDAGESVMMANSLAIRDDFELPNVWNAFAFAAGFHVLMFLWNPTLLSGGSLHQAPVLMQVEFGESLPKPLPPITHKMKREAARKAHKSGISLESRHQAVAIHPVKHLTQAASKPAPRTHAAPIKMPKFVPHASDDDALAIAAPHTQVALTTALRPASHPDAAPRLKGKSRGIRATDVHFELSDRSGISSAAAGRVVNIPIGEEAGDTAAVASAPELHDAPIGAHSTSGYHYHAPAGDGVGELAGKNRAGYIGSIQVGDPSEDEVIAAGNAHGGAAGHGVEIGGPVGDRKILRRHVPEYPAWAEEKGISAIVKIFFTVKADGTIRHSVRVVQSSGYTELDSLAKQALLLWTFSPTDASSSSEEAWGVITFRFTLA